MPLYTPFFERSMQTLGEGYGAMRTGQAARAAYMGDPNALGDLYRMDPNAGMVMQNQMDQRKRLQQQDQATQTASVDAFIRTILPQAAQLPYDQAIQFAQEQARIAGVDIGPRLAAYTPEAHKRLQATLTEEQEQGREVMQLFPKGGGEPMTVQTDGQGNFFDLQNNPIQLGRGDRLIEGSQLTGGSDDLGVTSTEAVQVREAEVSTQNFIDTVGDAITLLDETPDINTWAARAAGIVNNVQQEVSALAKSMNVEIDPELINPAKYEGTFDKLGIKNQRMRSLITSLAYSQALANNPDGRVSNADLNRAIDEIGGSASDPRAFRQTLIDVATRGVRSFQNRHKIVLGEDYSGDFGLGRYKEPDTADFSTMSDEELLNF